MVPCKFFVRHDHLQVGVTDLAIKKQKKYATNFNKVSITKVN